MGNPRYFEVISQESIWKPQLFSSVWILAVFFAQPVDDSEDDRINDALCCRASSFGSDGCFHQEIIILSKLLFKPSFIFASMVYKMY